MTPPTNLVLSSICLAMAAGTVLGADLLVPSQFPTIQLAINDASAGDVVIVAPGTYAENLNFLGKAITVRSSAGAAVTLIDAGGPVVATPGVSFVSGEGRSSVLEGFTIFNGYADGAYGGGASIESASPTIRGRRTSASDRRPSSTSEPSMFRVRRCALRT